MNKGFGVIMVLALAAGVLGEKIPVMGVTVKRIILLSLQSPFLLR